MAGKGGVVSYGTDSTPMAASRPLAGAKQSAKALQVRAEESTNDSTFSSTSSSSNSSSSSVAAAVKQARSQQPSGVRTRRAEDSKPSQIPEPLDDDDDDDAFDDSSEFDKSMQQMGNLLHSLHSKEARLNWMLEAVRVKREGVSGGVTRSSPSRLRAAMAGDRGAKHHASADFLTNRSISDTSSRRRRRPTHDQ